MNKLIYWLIVVILASENIFLFIQNFQLKKQINQVSTKKIVEIKPKEINENLINRCGDFPEEVTHRARWEDVKFLLLNGPDWSPDCRHVAWSSYYNFPGGWMGETENEPEIKKSNTAKKANEGLFIWDYKTDVFTKISDDGILIKWENANKLTFKSAEKTFTYDLILKKIMEE